MIILVTYDISDDTKRLHLHRFLKEFGLNTQKSVFECDIDDIGIKTIRRYCKETLDMATDSLRMYKICSRCLRNVAISGQGLKVTQLDYVIL